MQTISFTIPGKPFAWRRARSHGKIRFKDKATEAHEATLQAIALQHFPVPLEGPVKLTVRAVFKIPVSWSKKKAAALFGRPHTQKPDLSNLIKHVEDGLNRIAWVDDGQIAKYGESEKVWGDKDEMIVWVEPQS
ncbi:RusA family crossover junction endodeoxyribonuclease [Cereibacter sphaeroides]|nr:RusA family crossover junction endodeoxyribonuclease [Cereibacter sphaeroides]